MHIDKLLRTRRKTVALQVNDNAELVVRAPRWVAKGFIVDFVERHTDWIEQQKKIKVQRSKKFVEGELFSFLGREVSLRIVHGKTLKFRGDDFLLGEGVLDPKGAFEKWYKTQAKKVIQKRVKELSFLHGHEYNQIRITSAKTRWGSCSSKKNLSFTWRLVLAPPEVIDYVIIHELSHLQHMNHSRRFWNAVEKVCPEYQSHKKWLSKAHLAW